ncbi:nitrilase-related carbon-nitrogen hydrolase [Desulforamulus aeronauticus]|uniref:Predicted amidohydrolase n=1 Tax=Desulforamulus aeronauticus DSM 10349 TaxID=1121421 RepID=A0A1M6PXB7_9FIRM|nr:nitrilase-related carbon-nitrogen hydrolase [Desulforamulus aeronauticus]SHK12589.1 Predicted amidohydrolase [Desulforamulus aeronauticus DSM 10349]
MQDTTIALVQMQSRLGQIQENLNKIEHYVQAASSKNADIICFPEMCLQGYSRQPLTNLAIDLEKSAFIHKVKQMAKEKKITIILGMAEKNDSDKPFITQLVANTDGSILKYRKTHLGRSEQPHYSMGNEISIFNTPKASLGIQICFDMHFPEMTTILSLRGAEIIFTPHASPTMVGDRKDIWLKYLVARAYDNCVFVAACNLVGDDGTGHSYCGGAMVIDPKGKVIAEDFNGAESMLIAKLDSTKINLIRNQDSMSMANSFYLNGRRPELYGELVKTNVTNLFLE